MIHQRGNVSFKSQWLFQLSLKSKSSHFRIWLWGLPWRSSGEDSVPPTQGVQVRSLVQELRSHRPHGAAKNYKKKKNRIWLCIIIYVSVMKKTEDQAMSNRNRLKVPWALLETVLAQSMIFALIIRGKVCWV